MKVVLVGDVHLGWEETNKEKFKQFIEEELYNIEPDKLILNGDIAELWRSSFSNVMLNHSDVFQAFNELKESGIEVVPIAGNHDWRFIETSYDADELGPEHWTFREQYKFESGGEQFIATHGHEADPKNSSRIQNNAFCLTSEDTGEAMADTWGFISNTVVLNEVLERSGTSLPGGMGVLVKDGPLLSRPNLLSFEHFQDPAALSNPKIAYVTRG